jgi:hypothetical protein
VGGRGLGAGPDGNIKAARNARRCCMEALRPTNVAGRDNHLRAPAGPAPPRRPGPMAVLLAGRPGAAAAGCYPGAQGAKQQRSYDSEHQLPHPVSSPDERTGRLQDVGPAWTPRRAPVHLARYPPVFVGKRLRRAIQHGYRPSPEDVLRPLQAGPAGRSQPASASTGLASACVQQPPPAIQPDAVHHGPLPRRHGHLHRPRLRWIVRDQRMAAYMSISVSRGGQRSRHGAAAS